MLNKKLLAVCILYIIAFIYSMGFGPAIAKSNTKIGETFRELHESSIISCDACVDLTQWRGPNYYIGVMDDTKVAKLRKTLLTFWGLTHFLLYASIGYVAPDLFWETFCIGLAFEIFETLSYQCQDPLDLVWNSLGFLTGKCLRGVIAPT